MSTKHGLITFHQFGRVVQAVDSILWSSDGQMDEGMDNLDDPTYWDNSSPPIMRVPINDPSSPLPGYPQRRAQARAPRLRRGRRLCQPTL